MSQEKLISKRIDRVTRIPETHLKTICPPPRSVKMELNSRCNYKCSFCVRSIRKNDSQDMPRDFYSRIIREFKEAGVEELGLFYINEPFTVDWLPEAIAEAKAVGFKYVFLTTNGSIASPDKVEKCMSAGLNSLKFSINFSDDEQFKKVANVSPEAYKKALENLRLAREVRDSGNYDCGLYASSIAFDGEQGKKMQKIVDKYVKPYVDEFYFLPLYSMGGASENSGMKPTPGNPGRLDNMVAPLPCWSCFTEAHVMVNGEVSACCFGKSINDDGLIMGYLTTDSFKDIWNSPKFQELRKAHLAKDVTGTACEFCIR